ncbi:MAG TPA: hypothetical protein VE078_19530 [Thermoanaerobaculia bacterium]|nr:hypothetical protein [Thermoanaerobaculia bacterium]
MNIKKTLALLLMLVLPLALTVACGHQETAEYDDKDDTATATSEKEQPLTDGEADLNPIEAQTMIDDVTIGHGVDAAQTIPQEKQGDDFTPGETVHISMEVGDTPAGSAVKVVWYGPGDTQVGEATKTVAAGEKYLTFESSNTSSWAKGDYRAEVWIGDEKVNTQQFQIVDQDKAGR